MHFDLMSLEKQQVYRLLTHTIVPRPVAWILTENEDGSLNMAPFSYFNVIASDPALVMISVGQKRDGTKKDTWRNIEERQFCTIHIANTELMPQVNETARGLAEGDSELNQIEHELVAEESFTLPRLKSAPVAMSCKLHDIHLVGNGPQAVIYLSVKHIFVKDTLLTDAPFTVDAHKLDPISRLGGEDYASLGEITTLKRPT
ncbi:flavin reductase family protein [Reinekea marina]|uniref:Flavin reductase family protein n=1 Tax=Reinekea marina TaxID=1310421 RepID=A0ABV7WRF5_9GAMM|nr:flavin reductase family protein [Reinekea marina]MDN3648096.1 flavin reductase family protein [Reinekea marina]